jgi:NAD(P)-dependent dehydrogenase (short-subunit alcohol dehydrogenase family)
MAGGFAGGGHTVLGCGRTEAAMTDLAAELGTLHDFQAVDITGEHIDAWAGGLVERFGAPDLLINNAALMNRVANLWEVPPQEFSRLLEVNVHGTYRVLRAFLPAMIERGSGVLVNFSSGWGRSTSAGVAPYCATKYAIEGLTGALAQELPPGLAAVALNPGIIDTDMLRTAWGDGAAAYSGPESWAERAVPFLLGLGPEHNGQALTI